MLAHWLFCFQAGLDRPTRVAVTQGQSIDKQAGLCYLLAHNRIGDTTSPSPLKGLRADGVGAPQASERCD